MLSIGQDSQVNCILCYGKFHAKNSVQTVFLFVYLLLFVVVVVFFFSNMGQLRKKQATQAALLLYLITGYFSQMPACSK